MSGIEVAGLVLGAIPLVISAMEHYADGVSTMQRYRRYQRELTTLVNFLGAERNILSNTLELLLIDIAPPPQIEDMLKEPLGPLWCEPGLKRSIQTRLWRSYDVFQASINDVYAAIQEMYHKLGLQPDGTVPWLEGDSKKRTIKRTLQHLFHRASFSLRKSSYDDQLSRIQNGIASLNTLTAQNVGLEKNRKRRSLGRHLTLLRHCVKSVYRALQHGLGVRCIDSHVLHLALASRPVNITPLDDAETVYQGLSFRLAIPNHPEAGTSASAPSLSHVVVRRLAPTVPLSCSPSLIPPDVLSPVTSANKKTGRSRKTVRFLEADSISSGNSNTTTAVAHSISSTRNTSSGSTSTRTMTTTEKTTVNVSHNTLLLLPPMTAGSAAACLCETLSSARGGSSLDCYGLVEDPSDGKQYGLYPSDADGGPRASPWSPVSLREALEVQNSIASKFARASGKGKGEATAARLPFLTYRDRLSLALAVSSSVLHLHATPWLDGRALTCDDILFLDHDRHSGGSGSGSGSGNGNGTPLPFYTHPFVTSSVPRRPQPDGAGVASSAAGISAAGAGPVSADHAGFGSDADQTLPWLGVLLVELMLGPVVGGRAATDTGTGHEAPGTFDTADRLLDKVTVKSGIGYTDAARWCLSQYGRKMDVEDTKCQQDVYQNVIVLLEEAYNEALAY